MENMGYIRFDGVYIGCTSTTVGKKEMAGPLREWFDLHEEDEYFGMPTFEQAESEMVRRNLAHLFEKMNLKDEDVGVLLGGDLLNQCTGTSFGIKSHSIPFLGLYGACSTIAEGLLVGSMLVQGGFVPSAVAMASSHYCTAERQYRFPPEYGNQRPPTAQYTVTGAGAFYLTRVPSPIRIAEGIIGRIVDGGITDANNMGAAMAPAAADTILRYFRESGRRPEEFDAIVTGDLGREGLELVQELVHQGELEIAPRHMDGGLLIFDLKKQDMHCGGSGCGCLSTVLGGYLVKRMRAGELNRILAVGTGALLNASTPLQKLSIPGIAHAVCLEAV